MSEGYEVPTELPGSTGFIVVRRYNADEVADSPQIKLPLLLYYCRAEYTTLVSKISEMNTPEYVQYHERYLVPQLTQ